MSSLLAILLVVCSTGGHHFLFNYPPNPQRPRRHAVTTTAASTNDGYSTAATDLDRLPPNASSLKPFPVAIEPLPYPPASKDSILGIETEFLAGALAPKLPLCDRKFQLSINGLTFIGHPVSLPPSRSDSGRGEGTGGNDADEKKSHMTLFHVVFVISPPDLELNAQADALYTHVVRRYAAALQYEQLRCGYIQDEFDQILSIRDNASKGMPYEDLIHSILVKSSLARDIKQIYKALSTDSIAHIIINDFIDLSLQIPIFGENAVTSRSEDSYYASLMDIYGMSNYEYDNYPTICPYHTLLLLEDPEEVLKIMPLDASPTLVQLVQILTPTQRYG
ncbi:nitrogen permease regulator of amino acid transport activity 3-domain-containing protein [Dichotomocladium elegans]|nr:nitrogen permease regulator of amino acid transport activity 3-domain-containing protein [Dichotomocladium elegans]